MTIKQVYQTEDGTIFEDQELALHYENVVILANRLLICPHITATWPYDAMMTAAKFLYDQERIESNLLPIYREPEVK